VAEMDQGIKRLIQTHPVDMLALAVPGAQFLSPLQVDVATEPQLVLDTLLRVRYHGIECAVDIEAEARPHAEIGRRLFEYGSRASIVTGLPIFSAVLWLERGGAPAPSPYELRADDRLLATWHFTGIEVYRLRAEELIEQGPAALLPLVPFTDGGKELATIERAALTVKERAPAQDVQELEALLAVFATRVFDTDVILTLMRRLFMSTEIIGQSALYQEALAQGKADGLRDAALTALRGRFGELPADLAQAVTHASAEQIQDVLAHIGTDTLEQARARLGL
jgi:hypothetical protein